MNTALRIRPIDGINDVGGPGPGVSNLNAILGNTGGQTVSVPNLAKAYADEIARYYQPGSAKEIMSVKLPANYVNWDGFAGGAYATLQNGGRITMNVWVTGSPAEQAALRAVIIRSLQRAGFKNVRLEGSTVVTMVHAIK